MNILKRFGVYLFPWGKERPTLDSILELAVLAEEMGFDSVQLPWHYTLPTTGIFPDFGSRYLLDPLVVLPAIAMRTQRIKIALNSAILPVLHPFAWAQYLASLDVISGGRVIPGVALGWWEDDFKVGGAPLSQRASRTDEALEIMSKLWAGEPIVAPGRFWNASGLALDPVPVQQPFPVWIGGGAKSAPRAARWASTLFPLNPTADEIRGELVPALEAVTGGKRKIQLAAMNYSVVSDDERWIRDTIRPILVARVNGLSMEQARAGGMDVALKSPDDRVMYGNAEHCASRAHQLFQAGLDSIVLDFQFHGLEDAAFARHQMTQFVEQVVPLLEKGPYAVGG